MVDIANSRAVDIVRRLLRSYELNFTREQTMRWVGLLSDDPNNFSLIEEEIRQSDEFKRRFSGMQQRLNNGYSAISIDEYLALENGYRSTFRAAGLPVGFYDDASDLAEFIAQDLSVAEVEQRVAQGFVAARQAPQEVKDALRRFYNIPAAEAALAAYYLDTEKALPAIQREFEAAQVAGAAEMASFVGLSREQAEALSAMGVEFSEAQEGFGQLAAQRGLMQSNLGQGEDFTVDEQVAATFGNDGTVVDRIRRQREQRQAAFSGSAGDQASIRGVVGLQDTDPTT